MYMVWANDNRKTNKTGQYCIENLNTVYTSAKYITSLLPVLYLIHEVSAMVYTHVHTHTLWLPRSLWPDFPLSSLPVTVLCLNINLTLTFHADQVRPSLASQ